MHWWTWSKKNLPGTFQSPCVPQLFSFFPKSSREWNGLPTSIPEFHSFDNFRQPGGKPDIQVKMKIARTIQMAWRIPAASWWSLKPNITGNAEEEDEEEEEEKEKNAKK